ncbi:MAG: ChaN family lipoprotein [Gammaproteobacteria bacterium]|nr:ChaN family lipoprotein [Gammaproteobacteria bacterium]
MINNPNRLCRADLRARLLVWGIIVLSAITSGCTTASMSGWESELYVEHPLVGKIWDSGTGSFIDESELKASISNSQYFLLGEKHDNPDHHRLQLDLLNTLLASGHLDSFSLEMIDSSADALLETIGRQNFGSLDELKNYLQWDDEGWEWPYYGPLIMAALEAGVTVRSANISSQQVGEIYGQPLDENIASVLQPAAIEQLNTEIDESHCGMLPASQFPSMVGIQQARDYQMAQSLTADLTNQSPGRIRMLVAGNYHIRQDLSVPNYIMALDSSTSRERITALAIVEVNPESFDPDDYMQAFSNTRPFNYIWFTPAISNEDYCASLQQ